MYVKISRVKRRERLLLLNPPPNLRELMEAGPPEDTVIETRRPEGRGGAAGWGRRRRMANAAGWRLPSPAARRRPSPLPPLALGCQQC